MIVSILVWFIVVLVLIFLLRGIVKKCMEWSEPPVSRRIIIRRAGGESTIYTINPNQLQPGAVIHYQAGGAPPDYRTEILFAPSTDSLIKTDKDLPTYEDVMRQSLEDITENPNNTSASSANSNPNNSNVNSIPNTNSDLNSNINNINSNRNSDNNNLSDNNINNNNNSNSNSNNATIAATTDRSNLADIRPRDPQTTGPR